MVNSRHRPSAAHYRGSAPRRGARASSRTYALIPPLRAARPDPRPVTTPSDRYAVQAMPLGSPVTDRAVRCASIVWAAIAPLPTAIRAVPKELRRCRSGDRRGRPARHRSPAWSRSRPVAARHRRGRATIDAGGSGHRRAPLGQNANAKEKIFEVEPARWITSGYEGKQPRRTRAILGLAQRHGMVSGGVRCPTPSGRRASMRQRLEPGMSRHAGEAELGR